MSFFSVSVAANDGYRARVEQVAYRLLLGQDQPALGRRLVDRHDEHRDVALLYQVAAEVFFFAAGLDQPRDGLL